MSEMGVLVCHVTVIALPLLCIKKSTVVYSWACINLVIISTHVSTKAIEEKAIVLEFLPTCLGSVTRQS